MSLFATILALMGTTSAFADGISLGNPAYGGTGCPAGSASATLSPDNSALSLLFDRFVAEAGGVTGRTIDRKNCSLAIPVHVPSGFSVSLVHVDYRGFMAVPAGGRSTFNTETFFAGSQSPRQTQVFAGPQDTDYLISNDSILTGTVWSPCGQDVILRTNTSITAMTNSNREQVMSTLDSADIAAGVVYELAWRACF